MCKTYDAIYEISKHTESDILICYMGDIKIVGQLYRCEYEMGKEKCYNGVITLKDAKIQYLNSHPEILEKEYAWMNVASKQIKSFAFKCCEK